MTPSVNAFIYPTPNSTLNFTKNSTLNFTKNSTLNFTKNFTKNFIATTFMNTPQKPSSKHAYPFKQGQNAQKDLGNFIHIHYPQTGLRLYPSYFWKNTLKTMLECLENQSYFIFQSPSLDLFLETDQSIALYNKTYLACSGPTNILSFPSEHQILPYKKLKKKHIIKELGSLVLSINTLEREARLFGQDTTEHTIRLLAHGLVHLLGYDHGDEMQELTDVLEEHYKINPTKFNTIIPFWSYYHG